MAGGGRLDGSDLVFAFVQSVSQLKAPVIQHFYNQLSARKN